MSLLSYRAEAFGLRWRSDLPLFGFDACSDDLLEGTTPIDVHHIAELPDRRGGRAFNRGWVYDDGLRFSWEDAVVYDITAAGRIGYCPGAGWTGTLPASFYGTVAALAMAWRGIVPFHACAVELDGEAVLIAGPEGAGKSTLTAGLLAAGARFFADDLAAVSIDAQKHITIARGRPTIRLHRDTATMIDALRAEPVIGDPRGKWIAWPRHRSMARDLRVAAVLILDDVAGNDLPDFDLPVGDLSGRDLAGDNLASCNSADGQHGRHGRHGGPGDPVAGLRLLDHLFRPRWLNALPIRTDVMRKALGIATGTPVIRYRPLSTFDASAQGQRADDAITLVRKFRKCRPQ